MFKHLTIVSLFTVSTAVASAEQLTLYTEVFPPYNFVQHNQITGINTKIMDESRRMISLRIPSLMLIRYVGVPA